MPSEIQCHPIEDGVRCLLTGELDLASEDAVTAQIMGELAKKHGVLILDLTGLEFIDSTGLRVLLTARNKAGENGTRLLLTRPPAAVHRVFEIANVTEHFEYSDNVADGAREPKE
jgi:anti-sigma B factor antagonist